MKRLLKSLGFWIVVAMCLGIIAGAVMGKDAAMFAPLGTIFIQLIKMLVVPLVAISIISGTASLGGTRSAGVIGSVSIAYILLTTLVAVCIAFGADALFKPGVGADIDLFKGSAEVAEVAITAKAPTLSFWDTVIGMIPENPIKALADSNILQIITFGLLLGFGIAALSEAKRTKLVDGMNSILEALVWCVSKVMWVAPLGVFGLMADSVGAYGFEVLLRIIDLVWVYLLAILVMGLVVYPLTIVTMSRVSLKDFFREMLRPQLVAFSTASSMVTLPENMAACDRLGISKSVTGFVVPLGATINMSGNAIYYTLVTLFFADLYGMELSVAHYVAIALVATLGSIGQAGVPGPTLLVVAVMAAAGVPIEGLPILYALDRIFDMVRTVLNITGDAACAAVTDRFVRK
ncbi:MAG: dicarboxylate/amino acid:cation symporter [Alistipes sp.]|nr:dicarboxylate/amino acid:cation symporter [Alistipes sp.]